MIQIADVFRALGDPVRIEMVRRLADGRSRTITEVSIGLPLSRQGARKHIQVLVEAKLVALQPLGRDTRVTLLRDTLDQGRAFITRLELQWDRRLKALQNLVEQ